MTTEMALAPDIGTGGKRNAGTRRRIEAADVIIAASVALVVLIVGIFVFLCFQGYGTTIANTRTKAQTAANIVAEETRWVLSSTLGILDSLSGSVATAPSDLSADDLAAFRTALGRLPDAPSLEIFDASGALVAGLSDPASPPNAADRDYFQAIAGGKQWAISRQEGDGQAGEATFTVARRLEAGGAFAGIAAAVVNADVLVRFAEAQDLGAGATISIIRSDGWVIARHPSLPAALDLSATPAFSKLTAGPSGSYLSAASPADGIARIVAFRHLDDLGYIAIASISLDTALGGLWTSIIIVSLLLAPIAATVLAGSFVTAGLLRRSAATSRSLAAALEQNATLFREIHHRVKNNLESVNALLRLQKIPQAARDELGRRLFAMSSIHEHIYRSSNFAEVRARNYLQGLIANLRASYNGDIEVIEDIDDIAVHSDAATPLGLIVNEVVSNSFKHAFPEGRSGVIRVSLKPEDGGRARLTVSDNGIGLDPAAPSSGIGRRLVDGFVRQLRGESRHTGIDGSEFTLSFPLTRE